MRLLTSRGALSSLSPREDSFHSFFLVKPESVLDVPYFTTRTKRGTLPQRSSYIYCLYGSMLFFTVTHDTGLGHAHQSRCAHILSTAGCIFAHQHAHARAPQSHSAGHCGLASGLASGAGATAATEATTGAASAATVAAATAAAAASAATAANAAASAATAAAAAASTSPLVAGVADATLRTLRSWARTWLGVV